MGLPFYSFYAFPLVKIKIFSDVVRLDFPLVDLCCDLNNGHLEVDIYFLFLGSDLEAKGNGTGEDAKKGQCQLIVSDGGSDSVEQKLNVDVDIYKKKVCVDNIRAKNNHEESCILQDVYWTLKRVKYAVIGVDKEIPAEEDEQRKETQEAEEMKHNFEGSTKPFLFQYCFEGFEKEFPEFPIEQETKSCHHAM
jgi:hypothetical protein